MNTFLVERTDNGLRRVMAAVCDGSTLVGVKRASFCQQLVLPFFFSLDYALEFAYFPRYNITKGILAATVKKAKLRIYNKRREKKRATKGVY